MARYEDYVAIVVQRRHYGGEGKKRRSAGTARTADADVSTTPIKELSQKNILLARESFAWGQVAIDERQVFTELLFSFLHTDIPFLVLPWQASRRTQTDRTVRVKRMERVFKLLRRAWQTDERVRHRSLPSSLRRQFSLAGCSCGLVPQSRNHGSGSTSSASHLQRLA